MSAIKIAGVMRAGAYSPNHIGNDAAIFNAVADHLRKRGCEVNVYSEDEFQRAEITEDTVLNMCRERESVAKLQSLEEQGKLVINSGFGIENCTREQMTRMLLGNGIPYPDSLIVNTNEDVRAELERAGFGSVWIKRGDFHAMHKEDISYCRHAEEAQEMLHEYYYRGIKRAVINRHLVGDLVKFDPDELRDICQRASKLMDVRIYGGDCIIDEQGHISIIDFNDWPSFAPCRAEAAPAIARSVLKAIRKHIKNQQERP